MALGLGGGDAACCLNPTAEASSNFADYKRYYTAVLASQVADMQEQQAASQQHPDSKGGAFDIWEDQRALHYVQHGQFTHLTTVIERCRIRKRAASYTYKDGVLYRQLPDGHLREVPPPSDRHQLITHMHEQTGHFGARRTLQLLVHRYWWAGMATQVTSTVARCKLCDRARVAFNKPQPELHPLPICGLFYRWGVDLCGPFQKTPKGNKYVMVCVEHLSKHVELIPIPDKEPETVASALTHAVIGRFGAPAEIVTDGGSEWKGAFADLLSKLFIDHRVTSANHPESNGLAERAVQTVKRSLRKLVLQKQSANTWDDMLPWLSLGYRCSKQESTGFSPYELLYARTPTLPAAIQQVFTTPLDLGEKQNLDLVAETLLQRAQAAHQRCIIAGENLLIAQHRDTLRYARIRDGKYRPRIHRFMVGDYVYVHREKWEGLQMSSHEPVYRVQEVRPSGVLVLIGRCGTVFNANAKECAPCHLPNIDGTMDAELAYVDDDKYCEGCKYPDDAPTMLICDGCNAGWHMACLEPALKDVPEGDWFCPQCTAKGIKKPLGFTIDTDLETGPQLFPNKAMRARDEAAKKLHGRYIKEWFSVTGSKNKSEYWGLVHYKGPQYRPHYFTVTYEDGAQLQRSMRQLKNEQLVTIMPEGTKLPAGKRIPSSSPAVVAAVSTTSLDLHSITGIVQALHYYMPGQRAANHSSRLARVLQCMREGAHKGTRLPCVPTLPGEVRCLLESVDLSSFGTVVDPFCGTGGISNTLRAAGHTVITNDLSSNHAADYHLDASLPQFYTQLVGAAIVTSPWFSILDLVVPMMVQSPAAVVCVHVPGSWLTDAPGYRRAWLHRLFSNNLVHLVLGLPRGPIGHRCTWLVVFKTANLRQRCLCSAATAVSVSLSSQVCAIQTPVPPPSGY